MKKTIITLFVFSVGIVLATLTASSQDMEANKLLHQRLFNEVWNEGNWMCSMKFMIRLLSGMINLCGS